MSGRRHQWRAFVVFRVTDEDAAKFYAGPPGRPIGFVGKPPIDPSRLTLTADMIDQELSNVGCLACERSWHSARHSPCPGEPIAYDANGEPIYAPGRR